MDRKRAGGDRIEKLAQMVQRGFDEVATKQQLQVVADDLALVRGDIRDIKTALGPLVRHVAMMEEKVGTLEKRLHRVERKVGLA